MAAEQPKRRYRGRVDWDEAREFWLALEPTRRTSAAVAQQFGVSESRVRAVAKRDGWRKHAEDVDSAALERAKRRIVRSRGDRVQKVLGLIDGALDVYDEQLVEKATEARLRDLAELHRHAELLEGQATDRMDFAEIQSFVGSVVKIAAKFIARDKLQAFLDEIRGAAEQHDGDEQAAA